MRNGKTLRIFPCASAKRDRHGLVNLTFFSRGVQVSLPLGGASKNFSKKTETPPPSLTTSIWIGQDLPLNEKNGKKKLSFWSKVVKKNLRIF